jgi:taurine dioxygenase
MAYETMKTEAVTPHLGVKVTGVDLEAASADPEFIDRLKKLMAKHLVVFFPQQKLTGATCERLPAAFGPLVNIKRAGNVAHHVPEYEWIKVISNGKAPDGVNYGDGNASEQIWHSDSTPWEAPVGHIAFYCRQTVNPVPKTYFKNMIKVYAALPEAMKQRINDLRAIHHFFPRQIEVKIHAEAPSMPLEDRKLGMVHPLVRRHLDTNQPFLYLPTRRDSLIVGFSEEDSKALLTELWDFTNACDFDMGVGLEPDDFVIWDNSATVHSRDGWSEDQTRIMWHISSEGEVPTPMYARRTVNTIGLSADDARAAHKKVVEMSDY